MRPLGASKRALFSAARAQRASTTGRLASGPAAHFHRTSQVVRTTQRWQSTAPGYAAEVQITAFDQARYGSNAHQGPRPSITHSISQLSGAQVGSNVVIGGWLAAQRRAKADLHFFSLRDPNGNVQLVSRDSSISNQLMSLEPESVILVETTVRARKQKVKAVEGVELNPWDEVELEIESLFVLNPANDLPFRPLSLEMANENLRAKYRYLDLRRPALAANLATRSKVAHVIRTHLHDLGFTEVDTPILLNSSSEGAREFLVPTRTGSSSTPQFYALQQSPQQPKQLLIASGALSKYYQIARCFRDEDGRKDRQPEFTQVDLEMAWVGGTDRLAGTDRADGWGIGGREVKDVMEALVRRVWREIKGEDVGRIPVMPYQAAMDVYGSDKPDTRFKMYTLPIGYYPDLSDDDIDKILVDERPSTVEWMVTPAEWAKHLNVPDIREAFKDVDYVLITPSNIHSWPAESLITLPLELSLDQTRNDGVKPGDVIWLSRRPKIPDAGWTPLGRLRVHLADQLIACGALQLPAEPHFLWVTQFPLFTRSDDDKAHLSRGRWASTHHPFTAPMYEDLEQLKKGQVEGVRGQHYDLVLNGQEIGGGSVRVHERGLQEWIMREVLQLTEDEMSRFSHLLSALSFGAPPHAGMALGFDRLVAILCGAKSIREVIAFPKSTSGADPVFRSPSAAPTDVLREYALKPLAEAVANPAEGEEP